MAIFLLCCGKLTYLSRHRNILFASAFKSLYVSCKAFDPSLPNFLVCKMRTKIHTMCIVFQSVLKYTECCSFHIIYIKHKVSSNHIEIS